MSNNKLYKVYSEYLKEKYKEKVYRIPINLPVTCPNRDGCVASDGCSFCSEKAAGFEALSNKISVKEQLEKNIDYIGPRYKAKKYIAYFQNFTNTYLPPAVFEAYVKEAIRDDVVEISVSTRPDSLDERYLDILKMIKEAHDIEITIELGLQSINHKTLKSINRGHTLAEFIEAANLVKSYGFELVVHMILNLPYDDEQDIIEGAKILSALKVDAVKLHSLYLIKNTPMADLVESGKLEICSMNDYIKRTSLFLAHLSPDIVIQRLLGRAPKEDTIFCNYSTSWWKLKDMIEAYMIANDLYQGCYFDYLGGKAVRHL